MLNFKNTKYTFLFIILILSISCKVLIKADNNPEITKTKDFKKEYIGWWIYGEGQHIFKDEESSEEWKIEFVNENIEEIEDLYLSITEMDYFPMECKMIGEKEKNVFTQISILYVSDFEILYIQGCGDEENISE